MPEVPLGQTPYATQLVTLAAGVSARLTGPMRSVAILSATVSTAVEISFDGGSFFPLPIGISPKWDVPAAVWVKNTDGGANAILVAKGTAELNDRRLLIDALNPLAFSLTGNAPVRGVDAHDAAITVAPVLTGAEARATERAAVADADAVRLMADLVGRLVVAPYAPPELLIDATLDAVGGGIVDLVAAQAAGVRSYLTELTCSETGGTAATVLLYDGAALRRKVRVPANGSVAIAFPAPLRGSAATRWGVNLGAAGTVTVSASGYKGR